MSVYDRNAFAERVNYAARCIKNGHTNGRAFDTCFEMYDGDFVVTALVRRTQSDPDLDLSAKRILGINCYQEWQDCAANYASLSNKELKAESRRVTSQNAAIGEARTRLLNRGRDWPKATQTALRWWSIFGYKTYQKG